MGRKKPATKPTESGGGGGGTVPEPVGFGDLGGEPTVQLWQRAVWRCFARGELPLPVDPTTGLPDATTPIGRAYRELASQYAVLKRAGRAKRSVQFVHEDDRPIVDVLQEAAAAAAAPSIVEGRGVGDDDSTRSADPDGGIPEPPIGQEVVDHQHLKALATEQLASEAAEANRRFRRAREELAAENELTRELKRGAMTEDARQRNADSKARSRARIRHGKILLWKQAVEARFGIPMTYHEAEVSFEKHKTEEASRRAKERMQHPEKLPQWLRERVDARRGPPAAPAGAAPSPPAPVTPKSFFEDSPGDDFDAAEFDDIE